MKYSLAIFDFDGTLADSFSFFVSAVNKLADHHGFNQLDLENLDTIRGYDLKTILKHLNLPLWKTPIIGNHYKKLMAENIHSIKMFDGIESTLRTLAQYDITLAVVSSNSSDNVKEVLGPELSGLIGHFECGASLLGKRAHLKKILRRSGYERHQAIYIGDEVRDGDAAQGERIDFGAVAWGYTTPAALQARTPQVIFRTPGEIVRQLAPCTQQVPDNAVSAW